MPAFFGMMPERPSRPGRDGSGAGMGRDDAPSAVTDMASAEAVLGHERCPGCGRHCPLSAPSCPKGQRARTARLREMGLAEG